MAYSNNLISPTCKNIGFLILIYKDGCINYNLKKNTFISAKCSINICLLVGYNKKNIWQYIIQYNISFKIILLGSQRERKLV